MDGCDLAGLSVKGTDARGWLKFETDVCHALDGEFLSAHLRDSVFNACFKLAHWFL